MHYWIPTRLYSTYDIHWNTIQPKAWIFLEYNESWEYAFTKIRYDFTLQHTNTHIHKCIMFQSSEQQECTSLEIGIQNSAICETSIRGKLEKLIGGVVPVNIKRVNLLIRYIWHYSNLSGPRSEPHFPHFQEIDLQTRRWNISGKTRNKFYFLPKVIFTQNLTIFHFP